MDVPETSAPQPTSTPESVQPVPRSESGGWYDGPKASDATSETPGRDDAAPEHQSAGSQKEPNGSQEQSKRDANGSQKDQPGNLLRDAVEAKSDLKRVFADFKADNFQFDDKGKAAVSAVTKLIDKALDDAKGEKFDHQGFRDQILKHGVEALRDADKRASDNQRKVWGDLNSKWKTETRSAPDIGGPNLERSLGTAKAVIEEYGGNKDQQTELLKHLDNNGMGNFAGFIRLLSNIGQKLNVFEDGMVSPQGAGAPSGRGDRASRWYGNSNNGASG